MPLLQRYRIWLLFLLGGLLLALPVLFWGHAVREIVQGAAFSADGQWLARSSNLGLAVFDVRTGLVRRQLAAGPGPVAFSADGSLLACGDWGKVTVWDWRQGRLLSSWPGRNRWGFKVALSPDGTRVAGADDASLRV